MANWALREMRRELPKALVWTIVGVAITLLSQFLYKSLSEPTALLEYQVLSVNRYSKPDLLSVINSNFREHTLDLSVDDNIVPYYYLGVIELRNFGDFIREDVLFTLDFEDEHVKILDVLSKMTQPQGKELTAESERPPLEWVPTTEGTETFPVGLTVDRPKNEDGAIFYRSFISSRGFGRRSPSPSPIGEFNETVKSGRQYFYSAIMMGCSGEESPFTEIVPVPDALFNEPTFKDTITIKASDLSGITHDADFTTKVDTAIANLKEHQRSFVSVNRSDFSRKVFPKRYDGFPLFFRDDVSFLSGKTTLHLANIPYRARIRFFVVYKTYKQYDPRNIQLKFKNNLNIELRKKKFEPEVKKIQVEGHQQGFLDEKTLLTPFQARLFLAKGKVIIAYSERDSSTFKEIRIFRSKTVSSSVFLPWGEEIYRGRGTKGIVLGSTWGLFHPPNLPLDKDDLRPPVTEKRPLLLPPSGLTLSLGGRCIRLS
jgi:hypothetical protein